MKNNIQLTGTLIITIITAVKEILFNFLDDENLLLGAMVDERMPVADSAKRHSPAGVANFRIHNGLCEFQPNECSFNCYEIKYFCVHKK